MESKHHYIEFYKTPEACHTPMQTHLYQVWKKCTQFDEIPKIENWISNVYLPASNDPSITYSRELVKNQIHDLQKNQFSAVAKGILWSSLSVLLIGFCLMAIASFIMSAITFPKLINLESCILILLAMILASIPFIFIAGLAIKKALDYSYTVGANKLLIDELTTYLTEIEHEMNHQIDKLATLSNNQ